MDPTIRDSEPPFTTLLNSKITPDFTTLTPDALFDSRIEPEN